MAGVEDFAVIERLILAIDALFRVMRGCFLGRVGHVLLHGAGGISAPPLLGFRRLRRLLVGRQMSPLPEGEQVAVLLLLAVIGQIYRHPASGAANRVRRHIGVAIGA